MRRVWRLLLLACGWIAGLGLAMLPFPFLQWRLGFGYPGMVIHALAGLMLFAYLLLRLHAPERKVLRVATATAAALLFLTGLIQWEGHAGGYWQAREVRSTLDRLVREQQDFRDSTGRFSSTIPAAIVTSPRVVNLRMEATPVGFVASAGHTQLDAHCFVSVDTTASEAARQRQRPRCEVTGIREEDLLLPTVLIVGALLLGSWVDRKARHLAPPDHADGSPVQTGAET